MTKMIELPDKQYNIIYADPPWDIGGYVKETKKGMNDYRLPYETMTSSAIINLPIRKLLADNAILFMWVVDAKIPIVSEVMGNWGFDYKCLGFIWNKKAKTTKGTNAPFSQFTRRSCEYCFIGTHGKSLIKTHNVNQLVSVPKKLHSSKPPIFRTLIVDLCGNLPRIELFSRDSIEGWDAWGNQIPATMQKVLC